jgi:hypothetical protein
MTIAQIIIHATIRPTTSCQTKCPDSSIPEVFCRIFSLFKIKLNFETAVFYIQTKISKIINLLPVDFTWIGWIPVADSFEQSFI